MKISVTCTNPRYARGEYSFATFQELYEWLLKLKGLSKGAPGVILFQVAKTSRGGANTARNRFEINSDWRGNYFAVRELAFNSGILKMRMGGDSLSRDHEIAQKFAQELDRSVA